MKTNLKDLTLEELKQYCTGKGLKAFRGQQIFRWVWKKGIRDLDSITTLSKNQRESLKEETVLLNLSDLEVLKSKDGTKKFLFETVDGKTFESVYIPTKKRKTVCISTQIGCPLKCTFCVTGKSRFERNLFSWEIADQVRKVADLIETRITNVVLMGMGEPLLNYDNVMKAITILNDDMGMNIGARKITLSTAGYVPGIINLAQEPIQVKLAVSLNAATNEKRDRIMPINKKYNLSKLFNALEDYYSIKKKRVTFEYVLFKDFNDSQSDAKRLAALTERVPCKINIIPYNPIQGGRLRRPESKTIRKFVDYLYPIAQAVTLRESRGRDIEGACGQLRSRHEDK
jgi:23S rRNA (adenine2503-C2)-methyltransferase